MQRGPKPQLPATKLDKGTYQPCRDANRVEIIAPDALPQKPDWLTAAGEEVWMDEIGRAARMKLVVRSRHYDVRKLLQPSGLHHYGVA